MNGEFFRIPLGDWAESFVEWLTNSFAGFFDVLRAILEAGFDGANLILSSPPFWIVAIVLAVLAYWAKGKRLAVASLVGFAIIVGVDQWENAMATLALVIVASLIAIVIGIPVGIWAARNNTVAAVVRPILDFLQTMPAFVYLIPAVLIIGVGVEPGIVATIVFAVAPGVRMTQLGIRQVDQEVVEAGAAFGATPGRILRQIQLPLAMPTIMAGLNQVIMLSLSMVVISGMVGAPGLGQPVVQSLSSLNIGLGVEAGLAVVILAMFLDRVTAALGNRSAVSRALQTRAADD
ncbi:MAG: ABC transporter permease [Georgenia sp.]